MPNHAKHLAREVARDSVERALHDREARRHRGVSIAGLSPFDFTPVGSRDLLAAAEASAQREAAHVASAKGVAQEAARQLRTKAFLLAQYAEKIERTLSSDNDPKSLIDTFTALAREIVGDAPDVWLAAHDIAADAA